MHKTIPFLIVALVILSWTVAWAGPGKGLDVYFIDVEGGQSTLFVSPSGESLLVDTGWPGTRDADRIVGVAKQAGINQIDYLVLTHYHGDHAGGVVDLAGKIPIKSFVDHGPNVEQTLNSPQNYAAYLAVRAKGQHIQYVGAVGPTVFDRWHNSGQGFAIERYVKGNWTVSTLLTAAEIKAASGT